MKLFKITYNEISKQFKKPSIKIILAVILISAILLPMIINKFPNSETENYSLENDKYMLENEILNIENLSKDKSEKGKILLAYANIEKDYRQLIVDNEIPYGTWKQLEAEQSKYLSYKLAAMNFVLAGYKEDVVMQNLQATDPSEVAEFYKMPVAKRKEVQEKYTKLRDESLNIIKNNDYMAHTKSTIRRTNEYIDVEKQTIAEYEKLLAKNPKDEEGKQALEAARLEAESSKKSIAGFEIENKLNNFRLENKIDFEENNWKNSSLKTIDSEVREINKDILGEKEYSSQATMQGIAMTYDKYVENFNNERNNRIRKVKEIWYGLENNIPSLNDITDARSTLDKTYEIYIVLAIVISIIIGGGIVATEFSKGTIRLLLIRPASRWKILLSKLLAVLFFGISIVVLGIGILYISTGVVFGFDTYATPLLSMNGTEIVKSSFIGYLIPKILISSTSLLFISSLVFMISTLSRNTAIAVATSMVLYMGVGPISVMLISSKLTWLINTFIPYINSSYIRLMPSLAQDISTQYGLQFNFAGGALQLVVLSVIFLAITFVVFTKKDIKN
ncbi:MAG: ABC transporter permease subunit [Clostridium sp.]